MVCGVASSAPGQSKSNQPVHRPVRIEQGISSNEVHIIPTTMQAGSTSIDIGSDHWNARGYDLKTLISQIYDIDIRRVDFADEGQGDARYDLTLSLPGDTDEDVMMHMLQDALMKRFGLAIAPESRDMDVYVLTAPQGPGRALHPHAAGRRTQAATEIGMDDAGQITYLGKDCSGISSGGISASAGTIGEFRRTLEPDLDRLLIDETHLGGSYDFKIGNYASKDELFKLMREQLGLVVTPAQRRVTVLTVRAAAAGQEMRAAM
jgi:uncharacterized protein (TIGR03435 family)